MTETAPRPVYIAALPREVAALVRDWPHALPDKSSQDLSITQSLRARGIHLYSCASAVVACAGMGAARAVLALEAALALGPASEVVSIGWAGACFPGLALGAVLEPSMVVDTRTGERFATVISPDATPCTLATVALPASVEEKHRLYASYGAALVDMEAAAVARAAMARRIPFRAIKSVSDSVDLEVPSMTGFVRRDGHLREAAFALHLALRPALWRPVMQMARASALAANHLALSIRREIAHAESTTGAATR